MKKILIAILCVLAIAGCGDIDRYPGADEYAPGEGTEQEPGTDPEPEPGTDPEPEPEPEPSEEVLLLREIRDSLKK